jgi:hypothetical protein
MVLSDEDMNSETKKWFPYSNQTAVTPLASQISVNANDAVMKIASPHLL